MKPVSTAKTVLALSFLSICIVTLSLAFSRGSGAEEATEWKPLSTIVDASTLSEMIADNTAPSADRDAIAESAVGIQQGDLLVVDFKTPQLCGRGGCAISGYRASTGEQILFTYAFQTGPEQEIVELFSREGVELPCLLIAPSLNTPAQGLTQDALCYRDGQWVTEVP